VLVLIVCLLFGDNLWLVADELLSFDYVVFDEDVELDMIANLEDFVVLRLVANHFGLRQVNLDEAVGPRELHDLAALYFLPVAVNIFLLDIFLMRFFRICLKLCFSVVFQLCINIGCDLEIWRGCGVEFLIVVFVVWKIQIISIVVWVVLFLYKFCVIEFWLINSVH